MGPRLAVCLVPRQKTCSPLGLGAGDGYEGAVVMQDVLEAAADSAADSAAVDASEDIGSSENDTLPAATACRTSYSFLTFCQLRNIQESLPESSPTRPTYFDLILDCFDSIPREEEVEPRGGGSGSGDGDERGFDSALNPLRDRNVRFRGKLLNDLAYLSIETNCEYSER